MSAITYRPEIDGLRALAVVPVILFHAGITGFSGGYIGVDIFFVISGFLITSIILAEQQAGRFSLLSFYERRARRILPALFVVLLCTLPFAWMWLLPESMASLGRGLLGVALFASNVVFWRDSGYFEQAAELNPVLHTWSLAVEEQFYLLFPLFLGLLRRHLPRWTVAMLLTSALGSLAVAQWAVDRHPTAAFFLLPTRGWELLLGSLIAIRVTTRGLPATVPAMANAASLLGLGMIVAAIVAFDKATPFPGWFALLPTVGTSLVILFATSSTWVGRVLAHRWLVGVGLVSYSAYLWHQPLFALARHRSIGEVGEGSFMLLAVASLALAYLTWRFVERPFRDRQSVGRGLVASLTVGGPLLLAAAGSAAVASNGFERRFAFRQQDREAFQLASIENGWCFYSVDTNKALTVGAAGHSCVLGDRTQVPSVLLFGDSFAGQYEPLWDLVGRHERWGVRAITTNWCFPSKGEEFTGPRHSRAFDQCLGNREYLLRQAGRFRVVVLAGHWGLVDRQGKLDAVVRLIEDVSTRVGVVVLMPSPKLFDVDINRRYQKSMAFGSRFDIHSVAAGSDRSAVAAYEALTRATRHLPNVLIVDRESMYGPPHGQPDLMPGGAPYSWDGSHISVLGAKVAGGRWLESPAFAELRTRIEMVRPSPVP